MFQAHISRYVLDFFAVHNYNIIMNEISFEWDENKNKENIKKHGIDFDEAKTVFYDEMALVFDDPDHSYEEERFLIIGYSLRERICIVSHCFINDDIIRIISARKALKDEIRDYHDFVEGENYER